MTGQSDLNEGFTKLMGLVSYIWLQQK